jgi:hypothetical protein
MKMNYSSSSNYPQQFYHQEEDIDDDQDLQTDYQGHREGEFIFQIS